MVNIKKWEENEHWVEIDLDLCLRSAVCVDVCPVGVYSLKNGKVVAEAIGDCIQCLACQDSCPTEAIRKHFAWE
jgi:NAD-dependent dihydropyrimidine dehydrogenase PreA subunit